MPSLHEQQMRCEQMVGGSAKVKRCDLERDHDGPHRSAAQSLLSSLPRIPWERPLPVTVGDHSAWVCRYCVALYGVTGIDVLSGTAGYRTPSDCLRHIREEHA